MRRYFIEWVLLGLASATPSLAAQQKPGPNHAPKGQEKPIPMVDSDAPPTPSTPEEDMSVASYYIHKGDPDAAIPRLQEAIRLKPMLGKPRLMLAEVYEKKGDIIDAVKCYKDYLQALPNAPDAKKIERKIEKLTAR